MQKSSNPVSGFKSPRLIVSAPTNGSIIVCDEGLSFWGGVDPDSGSIIDAHHPQHGDNLAGHIVMMPTSRGSCSGSGVLLELAMNGKAPAALIFREAEDILTLGALIATRMFDCPVAIIQLPTEVYEQLATKNQAEITDTHLLADELAIRLDRVGPESLTLTAHERKMLDGDEGAATKLAMETLCAVAASQDAEKFIEVSRGHIDGCILAHSANLIFAEKIASMGAKVSIPTTINAISVDRENWQKQDVPQDFGTKASRLADAYVKMGARPTFTCAPYQADEQPTLGENIGWSESNAVIYANSVLGARTVKHPDYLDLFIALTGRAPLSGVYLEGNRRPEVIVEVELPEGYDDAIWPLIGWLAGQLSPNQVPLLKGLERSDPSDDDLRAICASFGTTSAAPLLHVAGVTPESYLPTLSDAPEFRITRSDFINAWNTLNTGSSAVDLVALGSPHFSLDETRSFAAKLSGQKTHPDVTTIITLGRETKKAATEDGTLEILETAGVKVISDLCWCSITEPVFPPDANTLMTNSGKYAHYGPGLSGRQIRFGSLASCTKAALTGVADDRLPPWLS